MFLETNDILKMIKAKSQLNVSFEMCGKHLSLTPLKPAEKHLSDVVACPNMHKYIFTSKM